MLDMQESVAERRSGYYNELAERARYDKEAFSELYDYFFPRVYNFIFAKVKNTEQADDIISITFEKIFVKLGDYDSGKGAFSTWIFRIALNENLIVLVVLDNLGNLAQRLTSTGIDFITARLVKHIVSQ